jgi:hypothetical protein
LSRILCLLLALAMCSFAVPRLSLYLEPLPDHRYLKRGATYTAAPAADGVEMRQAGSTVRLSLIGDARNWRKGVPHYDRVRFRSAWALNQLLAGCSIALNPTTMTIPDVGGTFATTVTAEAGCSWSTTTSVPWIGIISGSGSGNGLVQFTASPNSVSAPRSGFIIIGGQALVVTQNAPGQTTCGFALTTQNLLVPQTGQNGTIDLSAASGTCQWTAVSSVPWLQLFPVSGQGPAQISYTVYPNYTTSTRSTTAVIAGLTVSFVQPGSVATANERFVGQMYFNFFGRLASPSEIAFHTSFLAQGQPRGALIESFSNSEEFNRSGRFIAGLYVGILARDAEYGGWLFQRNALATGGGQPEAFVANFLNSAEYALKFGNMSNEQFVVTLYRNILLREPNTAEITFQAGALSAGVPRSTMASSFLNSQEFRLGTGPRLTSFLLHAVLLMREPGGAELATRAAQIQAGTPIRSLIDEFAASAEFASLLQ